MNRLFGIVYEWEICNSRLHLLVFLRYRQQLLRGPYPLRLKLPSLLSPWVLMESLPYIVAKFTPPFILSYVKYIIIPGRRGYRVLDGKLQPKSTLFPIHPGHHFQIYFCASFNECRRRWLPYTVPNKDMSFQPKCAAQHRQILFPTPSLLLLSLVLASLLCACSRPPADESNSVDSQKLPFDRTPRSTGVSPSQTLLPSSARLPEGTPLPIRLQSALSSASAHAGDTFYGVIDEPVTIDGQTGVEKGTDATGRVLEAKAATVSRDTAQEPGYLRIVLVSLNVGGKTVAIETSSIFAKGGSREERNPPASVTKDRGRDRQKDIVFGIDRRLNFRLAQSVDLQP
jgi:hypothetical protein